MRSRCAPALPRYGARARLLGMREECRRGSNASEEDLFAATNPGAFAFFPHPQTKGGPLFGTASVNQSNLSLPNAPKPGIAKRWGLLIIPWPHREDSNSVAWVGKFAPDDREQPMSNPQNALLALASATPFSLALLIRLWPRGAYRPRGRRRLAQIPASTTFSRRTRRQREPFVNSALNSPTRDFRRDGHFVSR